MENEELSRERAGEIPYWRRLESEKADLAEKLRANQAALRQALQRERTLEAENQELRAGHARLLAERGVLEPLLAVMSERARIRRELLASTHPHITANEIRNVVNRILPEEPHPTAPASSQQEPEPDGGEVDFHEGDGPPERVTRLEAYRRGEVLFQKRIAELEVALAHPTAPEPQEDGESQP